MESSVWTDGYSITRRSRSSRATPIGSARASRKPQRPEEEMNRVGAGDAPYVAAVLMLYTDLPDTPLRPSQMDQSVARKLHQEAIPLVLVESALMLATLRRLTRSSDLPPL